MLTLNPGQLIAFPAQTNWVEDLVLPWVIGRQDLAKFQSCLILEHYSKTQAIVDQLRPHARQRRFRQLNLASHGSQSSLARIHADLMTISQRCITRRPGLVILTTPERWLSPPEASHVAAFTALKAWCQQESLCLLLQWHPDSEQDQYSNHWNPSWWSLFDGCLDQQLRMRVATFTESIVGYTSNDTEAGLDSEPTGPASMCCFHEHLAQPLDCISLLHTALTMRERGEHAHWLITLGFTMQPTAKRMLASLLTTTGTAMIMNTPLRLGGAIIRPHDAALQTWLARSLEELRRRYTSSMSLDPLPSHLYQDRLPGSLRSRDRRRLSEAILTTCNLGPSYQNVPDFLARIHYLRACCADFSCKVVMIRAPIMSTLSMEEVLQSLPNHTEGAWVTATEDAIYLAYLELIHREHAQPHLMLQTLLGSQSALWATGAQAASDGLAWQHMIAMLCHETAVPLPKERGPMMLTTTRSEHPWSQNLQALHSKTG